VGFQWLFYVSCFFEINTFKVALLLFRNKKRFRRNNFTSNSRNLQAPTAPTAPPTNSMWTFSQLHKNVIVVVGWLQIPIVTSNTNCYFNYQLLLQIPIVTSYTNCYFKYQLLLQIPIGTSNTLSNDPTTKTRTRTTKYSRLKSHVGNKICFGRTWWGP
jgi:hypothetical protein